MTPGIMWELAEAETAVRLTAATLTKPGDSAAYLALLTAAARLHHAREALHEMARAPVPEAMRHPGRARLRVIEGGAA